MLIVSLLFLFNSAARADQVQVLHADLELQGNSLNASVTLRHADTGWKHYANAWRVVDEKGRELGIRILFHPHVGEQPFTRSKSGIHIPEGTRFVYVEGRDSVHGWSKSRIRVDLEKASGKHYKLSIR
jgi:hypothetical protein